jgi:hypothetical protein
MATKPNQLERSRAYTRSVLESVPDAMAIVNAAFGWSRASELSATSLVAP